MQKTPPPTANGELSHEEDPAADNFVHDASTQVPPQMHTNMNGGMPPQQVYVENNIGQPPNTMAGLETQFQTLGMQQQDEGASNDHDNNHSPPEGSVEHDEGNDEGGEGEDDPLKLFVGQVRPQFAILAFRC